jgi:hypothetical protein
MNRTAYQTCCHQAKMKVVHDRLQCKLSISLIIRTDPYAQKETDTHRRCMYSAGHRHLLLLPDRLRPRKTRQSQFRSQLVLDLEEQVLYYLIPHRGRSYLAKLSESAHQLAFPKRNEKSRTATSYGTSQSISTSNSEPIEMVTVGDEEAQPTDAPWTKTTGVLVGTIIPKRSQ